MKQFLNWWKIRKMFFSIQLFTNLKISKKFRKKMSIPKYPNTDSKFKFPVKRLKVLLKINILWNRFILDDLCGLFRTLLNFLLLFFLHFFFWKDVKKISVALNIFVGHKVDLNFLPFSFAFFLLCVLFAFFLGSKAHLLLLNMSINKKMWKEILGAKCK